MKQKNTKIILLFFLCMMDAKASLLREMISLLRTSTETSTPHSCDVALQRREFIEACAQGKLNVVVATYKEVSSKVRQEGYEKAWNGEHLEVIRFFLWKTDVHTRLWFFLMKLCREGKVELFKTIVTEFSEAKEDLSLCIQDVCCNDSDNHVEIVSFIKNIQPQGLEFSKGYCVAAQYGKRKMADLMMKSGALDNLLISYRSGYTAFIIQIYETLQKTDWEDQITLFKFHFPFLKFKKS